MQATRPLCFFYPEKVGQLSDYRHVPQCVFSREAGRITFILPPNSHPTLGAFGRYPSNSCKARSQAAVGCLITTSNTGQSISTWCAGVAVATCVICTFVALLSSTVSVTCCISRDSSNTWTNHIPAAAMLNDVHTVCVCTLGSVFKPV